MIWVVVALQVVGGSLHALAMPHSFDTLEECQAAIIEVREELEARSGPMPVGAGFGCVQMPSRDTEA